jgi:hypothetical protein
MADFRSAYTRGVFNGAVVGRRNSCHVTGTEIDESYLYEEGRCAAYQHRNRAIVLYAPKRSGHLGVTDFRVDLIFSYYAPFSALILGERAVERFPQTAPPGTRLFFQDHHTYGAVIPLGPDPRSDGAAVRLDVGNDHLMYSLVNYEGPTRDFDRDDIMTWRSGFALELATTDEFTSFDEFLAYARELDVTESLSDRGTRSVVFESPEGTLKAIYDPTAERFLSRTWNGEEETVDHLRVEGGIPGRPLITPLTLFGSEAMSENS